MGKVEGEKANLTWNRRPRGFPAKPAGNHQMEHEEDIALQLEDDSLTKASQHDDRPPANRIERRVDGSQEKGRRQAHVLNRVTDDARAKCVEIELDIREFGHALDSLAAREAETSER